MAPVPLGGKKVPPGGASSGGIGAYWEEFVRIWPNGKIWKNVNK